MTFLNFSDYLKSQLKREVKSEEFSKFILNQKLMKIGKRSEMNANTLFYYDNTTGLTLDADNVISGNHIEFHSCDRSSIYFTIVEHESVVPEKLFLKAELDKATVAGNLIFLIKRVSLIVSRDLVKPEIVVKDREAVEVYA